MIRDILSNREQGVIDEVLDRSTNATQIIVAIEELAELQKELTKVLREQGNSYNVAEEMADVVICLAQLEKIFDNTEKLELYKDFKIDRLEERLRRGEL